MAKSKEKDAQAAQDGPAGTINKKKSESRSKKAGLKLSVSRVHRAIKNAGVIERIGMGAPVFMTAVIEYVASEVISLAADATKRAKRKRILPEDISQAIRADPELHKLMEGFRVFTGDKYSSGEIAGAILCKEDAARKKKEKAEREAAKAAAKAAAK